MQRKSVNSRGNHGKSAGTPSDESLPAQPAPGRRQLALIPGRLDDSFFEPLPPEEIAAWQCDLVRYRT